MWYIDIYRYRYKYIANVREQNQKTWLISRDVYQKENGQRNYHYTFPREASPQTWLDCWIPVDLREGEELWEHKGASP